MNAKEKIVTQFVKMFVTQPIESITVSALCAKAGVHRSTFYLHFSSLDQVLEYVEEGLIDQARDVMEHVSATSLLEGIRHNYRFFEENAWYITALAGMQRDPHFIEEMKKVYLRGFDKVIDELFLPLTEKQQSMVHVCVASLISGFLFSVLQENVTEQDYLNLCLHLLQGSIIPVLTRNYGLCFKPGMQEKVNGLLQQTAEI